MPPTSRHEFLRQRTCTEQSALLAYHAGTLSAMARAQVRAHLGRCDFCGAASHLLSKHRPTEEPFVAAPLPLHLRLVAETLLAARPADRKRAA